MKICRISFALPPVLGGLEEHVAELSARQVQAGHEVHLVFATGEPLAAHGVMSHRVSAAVERGGRSTQKKLRFMRAALPTLRRLLREQACDIVDAHGDFVEAAFVGALGKLKGVPTVMTIHGGLSERRLTRLASSASFELISHFIVVSDEIRQQLLERDVSPKKISVISSGVDVARFTDGAHASRREEIVLFVGRLHKIKGVDVLLEAASFVARMRPSARFVIVGDGDEFSELRERARALNNVQFTGALNSAQVDAWLRRASVFVMPSVPLSGQSEGQPRAVMEAMAAGLPIVASRTGGIPELVHDGKGGRLVEPRNPLALSEAIVSVMSNPELAAEMGGCNRRAIVPRDFANIEHEVTALFEKLVRQNKSAS
jgi:glycosyltransferase involved in cell wall biosynthesis